MAVHVQCTKCGELKWVRSSIVEYRCKKEQKTREEFYDTFMCKKCRKSNKNSLGFNTVFDTWHFNRFEAKLLIVYKKFVASRGTIEDWQKFKRSTESIMRENHVEHFRPILVNNQLVGFELFDFPVFGKITLNLYQDLLKTR